MNVAAQRTGGLLAALEGGDPVSARVSANARIVT